MLLTIVAILTDITLGAMAYRIARALERTQIQQTVILQELTKRVEKLEAK